MNTKTVSVWTAVFLAFVGSVNAQEPKNEQPGTRQVSRMTQNELLKKLIGKWEGSSRTWAEPGKLFDESKVAGEFVDVLDGRFVRHTYGRHDARKTTTWRRANRIQFND